MFAPKTIKRICGALLAAATLLCSGCYDYSKMTDQEILVHAMKCSAEQAQSIDAILKQCGVSRIQNIDQGDILTCPEGELYITFYKDEKDLNGFRIDSRNYQSASRILYMKGQVHETLVSSEAERQYYLDTTASMISSIEDKLVVIEHQTYMGIILDDGKEKTPPSLKYDGRHFISRTPDGIVHVVYIIYTDTYEPNVDFTFEAQYAMLSPVSLTFYAGRFGDEKEEIISHVWNGAFYEARGKTFDALKAEAAGHADTFTEAEINSATQALKEFQQG